MFDRISNQLRLGLSSVKVTVTENKAPTDESVRLLGEMEAAVMNRIIGTTRLQNADVECVVHVMLVPADLQREVLVIWRLNRHSSTTRLRINEGIPTDEACRMVRDAVAQDMATELLANAFNTLKGL